MASPSSAGEAEGRYGPADAGSDGRSGRHCRSVSATRIDQVIADADQPGGFGGHLLVGRFRQPRQARRCRPRSPCLNATPALLSAACQRAASTARLANVQCPNALRPVQFVGGEREQVDRLVVACREGSCRRPARHRCETGRRGCAGDLAPARPDRLKRAEHVVGRHDRHQPCLGTQCARPDRPDRRCRRWFTGSDGQLHTPRRSSRRQHARTAGCSMATGDHMASAKRPPPAHAADGQAVGLGAAGR